MPQMLCTLDIPTHELYSGAASYVQIPGEDGSFGVCPGHEMLLTTTSKGLVTIQVDEAGNDKREFLVYDGAAEVFNDKVTILARFGRAVEDINADEIREKEQAIRDMMKAAEGNEEEQRRIATENFEQRLDWYAFQLAYIGK